MLNLNNIDLSKEYRSTDDELKSAKSYIYQLVQELEFRLGLIDQSIEGGTERGESLPAGGKTAQPLIKNSDSDKDAGWGEVAYLTGEQYKELANLIADDFSEKASYDKYEWCKHNGFVWEAKNDLSAGSWNEDDWEEIGAAT